MKRMVEVRHNAGQANRLPSTHGGGEESATGAMEALGEEVIPFNAEGLVVAEGAFDFRARDGVDVILLTEALTDTRIRNPSPPRSYSDVSGARPGQ